MLVRLYSSHKDPSNLHPKAAALKLHDEEGGQSNGHPRGGNNNNADRDRQVRDVQEFELEGLMSEDGDDEAESSSDGARGGFGVGRGRQGM